ncbi:MAG: hypothetical protein DHS20C06_03600 [Hyphobacterium sp.]|nr:MAG: hypothetical protein DHS20C06_03600 [Hyphobacterium sp.]
MKLDIMNRRTPLERLSCVILELLVARSAQKVLLIRELVFEGGSRERWLKQDIKRFWKAMNIEARKVRGIKAKRPDDLGNKIMVEMTLRTIAAYRALREMGVERACARRLVADIIWDIYSKMLGLYSWPFRLTTRDPSKRISRTIKALLWFPFNAPGAPGYAVKHWEKDGDTFTHFTHCPPHSFVRVVVASGGSEDDLLAFRESWCRYDWPGADILAGDGRRSHYERNKTLSHGDSVCDMCWRGRTDGI